MILSAAPAEAWVTPYSLYAHLLPVVWLADPPRASSSRFESSSLCSHIVDALRDQASSTGLIPRLRPPSATVLTPAGYFAHFQPDSSLASPTCTSLLSVHPLPPLPKPVFAVNTSAGDAPELTYPGCAVTSKVKPLTTHLKKTRNEHLPTPAALLSTCR